MDKVSCPRGEKVWVGYYNASGELRFIVTSKEKSRDNYFLYEFLDGQFKRLGKSHSPKELEEKLGILAKLMEGYNG